MRSLLRPCLCSLGSRYEEESRCAKRFPGRSPREVGNHGEREDTEAPSQWDAGLSAVQERRQEGGAGSNTVLRQPQPATCKFLSQSSVEGTPCLTRTGLC